MDDSVVMVDGLMSPLISLQYGTVNPPQIRSISGIDLIMLILDEKNHSLL